MHLVHGILIFSAVVGGLLHLFFTVWILGDAADYGVSAWYAVGAFFVGPVVVPLYLALRTRGEAKKEIWPWVVYIIYILMLVAMFITASAH